MSRQPLNLRRSLQILRQHWITAGVVAMLGFLAGAAFVALNPPMYISNALVVLPTSTHNATTQAVIAGSNPVLEGAAQSLNPALPLQTLNRRVQITTPIAHALLISAQGETAAQAVDIANAVADSYVAYVSAASIPGGQIPAQVLQRATLASKTPLLDPLLVTAAIGALAGFLTGTVGLLAVNRGDGRLRRRDEIADAIGVPVLASVSARHPTTAHHWTRLLDEYEPRTGDAQRLRNVLDYAGLPGSMSAGASSVGSSLTVLSLSSDQGALALGPQLAVFAARQGIPTTLVVGGEQDVSATRALRAACTATPSSARLRQLRTAVADHEIHPDRPDAGLTVVVATADSGTLHVVDTVRAGVMVLGVSAGAATADQLARVVASAAADGRHIAAILMADPYPADPTTGGLPQLGRRTQLPTRMTGTALVAR
jgi:capsular polysaccharide biosynthesis protein